MARRFKGRVKTRTRTRTVVKTRRIGRVRNRIGSFRSRHSGKADHAVLLAAGAGAGALSTTAVQLLQKNGVNLPSWASYALSAITGLLVGKHIGHNWMKGVESSLAGVATSYVEQRVTAGMPILNTNIGSPTLGGNVY